MIESIRTVVYTCDHCGKKGSKAAADREQELVLYDPPKGWWVLLAPADGVNKSELCSVECAEAFLRKGESK